MLFGLERDHLLVMSGATAILALVAIVAALVPARAAFFFPLLALRHESLSVSSVGSSIAITNVTVVDVVSGRRETATTVLTKAGEIGDIGRGISVAPGAMRVDGTDKFLIPGLWDMHSHNQASGAESLELYLAQGVVGTRDMGSDLEFILPLRDRIGRGELSGPEISQRDRYWTTRQRIGRSDAESPTLRKLVKL